MPSQPSSQLPHGQQGKSNILSQARGIMMTKENEVLRIGPGTEKHINVQTGEIQMKSTA